jgi:FkbM family methyltransferase
MPLRRFADWRECVYYSQFGEDRLLQALLGGKGAGTCVEVGANDGRSGSNSLFFEQNGWDCILVEANPELCATLRRERTGQVFECAASAEEGVATLQLSEGEVWADQISTICTGEEAERSLKRGRVTTRAVQVRTRRLDDILDEARLTQIDFITIDVEGHELEVLKGLTLDKWRPTILIIEDNVRFTGRGVRDHLNRQGYVRFHRTGINDWYAHQSNPDFGGKRRRLRYLAARAWAPIVIAGGHAKVALYRLPGVAGLHRRLRGRK